MNHEAVINSILKTWGAASSLWIIFRQSSPLVRKWKELFGKKSFHKQTGLCNNLKYPTDFIAKYITGLGIVSYFAIFCLSSETIHYSSSPILIVIAIVYPGSHPFLPGVSPLSCLTRFCSCYCFGLGVSCYYLNLKNFSFFNLSSSTISLLTFVDCSLTSQI